MKTTAVRLYGKNDLRLETFDLPDIKPDEILAKIVSDSICMSSYKAASQGGDHKRVPNDVENNPVIIGHEFCGEIVQVGQKWQSQFKAGEKFAIQPALNYKGSLDAPGYSYKYIGGDATYVIIPNEVMECNCLLHYNGDSFYQGSLTEPLSCIIAGYHENFHSCYDTHTHAMGIKQGGAVAILAGAGPMGLGAIDYGIHGECKPRLLIVTDIDDARLQRASQLITVQDAAANGVQLVYVNTSKYENPVEYIKSLNGGNGFDDVFVYAPVSALVEQGNQLLGFGGCLNFFAGPTNPAFEAKFNFYDVHYSFHRITGTSGGNTNDMIEALELLSKGKLNSSIMITHVGGLDCVVDTTLNLPHIKGAKKLIYTHISMPLTAIEDFEELGKNDPLFFNLGKICKENNGLWCDKAEKYLLSHGKSI